MTRLCLFWLILSIVLCDVLDGDFIKLSPVFKKALIKNKIIILCFKQALFKFPFSHSLLLLQVARTSLYNRDNHDSKNYLEGCEAAAAIDKASGGLDVLLSSFFIFLTKGATAH